MVDVIDLLNNSEKRIIYKCDCCGLEFEVRWDSYYKKTQTEYYEGKDYCAQCTPTKRAEWYKNNNPDKYEEINLNRYNSVRKAVKVKYGVDNIMLSEVGKERLQESIFKKYGVNNILELPEIRAKIANTFLQNSEIEEFITENGKKYYRYHNVPCSENLYHFWLIYRGELNAFIKYYSVDLLFAEEKIYFEYNGPRHNLGVIMKRITEEELKQKDIIRYITLKNLGYKQFVFASHKRKLPSDDVLILIKQYAFLFLTIPDNNWIEINWDELIMRTKNENISLKTILS